MFSPSFEQHLRRLEAVFYRLIDANLKLNLSKCTFCLAEVTYLGIKVTSAGQFPDPDKIKSVKDFKKPTDITGIRSFVSLCSYYRKFVPNFADKAKPLTTLIKNDVEFVWTDEQEKAFEDLKNTLINPPVLAHFNDDLETEVRTDASNVGIGAILAQKHAEGWKPVCFASRQLLPREQNYTVSEKECLAIVFALEKFRQYLENRYFVIKTDYCSLCFLQSKQKLPSRLMRWSLMLQEFHFDIVYKSGTHNRDADCLSRYPSFTRETEELENDDKVFALAVMRDSDELRAAQNKDPAARRFIRLLTEGGSKGTKKSCHFRISSNRTSSPERKRDCTVALYSTCAEAKCL